MGRWAWGVVFSAGSLVVAACSADSAGLFRTDTQAESAGANGLPCAVDDVLARNCRLCHTAPPRYGAPMPLVAWDDLQKPALSDPSKKVFEMVETRIHHATRPMPPMGPLAPADMRTLDDWIAAGAPRSNATCGTSADGGTDPGALPCTVDRPIAPAHAWTVSTDSNDEYVCYGIDVTTTQKRQAIAIAPHVDNHRVVHHMDLFEAPEGFSREPTRCSPYAVSSWRMVYAWAPGGGNMILPSEAGFPLEGTTHLVVQVHYFNPNHLAGEVDATGVDMCTTDQLRPNDADVMVFGSEHFTIPPRAELDLSCDYSLPSGTPPVHVFATMLHMHNYGRSMSAVLEPQSGGSIELARQAHWDIANQSWFSTGATIAPGDRVRTRCEWANTSDGPVSYGDSSADEMCFAYAMYYPRVTTPNWSWSVPATGSTCTPSH